MSTAIQEQPIFGREPSPEELELVAWAEEAASKGVGAVHEGLRQLVTLTTALLAGSAALLDKLPVSTACKVVFAGLLLVALATSLWGSLPREVTVDVHRPDKIKAARARSRRQKMACLKAASTCLVLAFCVLLGGLLARL
jgi:hypothetical protein